MPRNAVFLDRDGTIAVDVHYCRRPEQFQLLPRAGEAVALLNRAGLLVVVVTNQSAIGRGELTEAGLYEIHAKMRRELAQAGAQVDAIYHCPHLPEAGCACRKPAGALFHRAAEELGVSLPDSYMVGDKAIDILSGRAVGSRTVLVRSDQSPASTEALAPDHEALTLYEAVRWILRQVAAGPAAAPPHRLSSASSACGQAAGAPAPRHPRPSEAFDRAGCETNSSTGEIS